MEMKKVINRANYARPYLVHKVVFPARSVAEIDSVEMGYMQANAPMFQQLVERGLLVPQGTTPSGKSRVMNLAPRDFTIKYPCVYLKPGENEVPAELWDKVLEEYGEQVATLQGQPDGLIY